MAAPQGFYRQPTLYGDTVVFLSQGDLWRAPVQGGTALRLTSHAGQESNPVLLPDGRTLAYVGHRDGTGDIYTQPVDGGEPTRHTWLASNQLRLWGSDAQGALLLTAPAVDGRPVTQAFRLTGERLEALPIADASDLAASLDGKQWIFTRNGLRGDNAKGYRGGAVASLWHMDQAGGAEARALMGTDFPVANNKRPMPYRDAQGRERIAFLSDRDGIFNVWSVAADGSDARQHTRWREFDVRWASIQGSQVVFARGADLHRIDLNAPATAQPTNPPALAVTLLGDQSQSAGTRWVKRPQEFLTEVGISPDGERALIGVRGRLASQGTQGLRRAVLQQADGSRCREANFSPNGKWVYALCDFSGEVEVWQLDALGGAARKQLTHDSQVLRTRLKVSPDGRYLAHADLSGALALTDLKAEGGPRTLVIDQATRDDISTLAWHPDSQALAYAKAGANAGSRTQIWLYALADKKAHALTTARYDSTDPVFSPDGQWLYFSSRRHFATQHGESVWADRNMGPAFEPGIKVYALALQAGLVHPTEAKNELTAHDKPKADTGTKGDRDDSETKGGNDTKDAKDAKDAKESKDLKDSNDPKETKSTKDTSSIKSKLPKMLLDGLADRLYELPLPAGTYRDLRVDAKRLWWLEAENADSVAALRSIALERGANAETHSEKVRHFELSGNGKQLLLQREPNKGATPELLIVDAAPKLPSDLSKSTVRWSDWNVDVNPRQEWQQLFDDAWRLSRDHFYDARLQGVDWNASRARHAALLPRVGDRLELAELMAQMTSDLNLLHSQIAPGDLPPLAEDAPALAGLGAQLEPHAKGARIVRIYRTDAELVSERGPLQAPHMDVREGDVITAINGRAVVWPKAATLLQGEAGKQVRLEVQRGASAPRSFIVTAVDARRDSALRYQDWRLGRMAAVDKASNGRIGYLHLRAMGRDDIADFAKDFYAQLDKEALIVDVRFNNGGNIDSWILEKLLRRAWEWWQPRHPSAELGGAGYPNMQGSFNGPLAALINENTYSDGETFAEGFKRLKLGPVIGKTTSGAGVFLSDRNRLMDRGIVRAAESAQLDADGKMLVEGKGVTPDLEVDNPPRATAAGGDAQLDAAVATLISALPTSPPQRRTPTVGANRPTLDGYQEGVVKSLNSNTAAQITFTNGSGQEAKVYWLDFDGHRVLYKVLTAGESYDQQTYLTHPWIVTDARGIAWHIYFASAQPRTINIVSPVAKKS